MYASALLTGTPLSHGLVTAIGTYLVAQAVFALVRVLRGQDVRWFAIMFNLAVVLGAGGMEKIIEVPLTEAEQAAFAASVNAIREMLPALRL